jgi:hypothetical protein
MAIGDTLLALCRMAQQELLLVAPFVKLAVLERIVSELPDTVSVRCVTRWYPHEVAAGVSDLEIWPLLKNRPNSNLWLRSDLHAKYYRADRRCLIGSANLTATALGWREPANLEILLPYPAETPELQTFESRLFAQAIEANETIYQQMLTAVECLPKPPQLPDQLENLDDVLVDSLATSPNRQLRESGTVYQQPQQQEWFPQTRHPEDLYKAYTDQWDRLTSSTQVTAAYDLQFLAVPPGLSAEGFRHCIGAMLLQQPVVQQIDGLAARPQRFGAIKNLLANRYRSRPQFDPGYGWQTLMRWLLFFLPYRYSVSTPRHSEIFSRV